jgi:putative oxidoreductase
MRCASAIISWNGSGEAHDLELYGDSGARYLLVVLFLPSSALDKILNFSDAVAQAREAIPSDSAARLAIVAALRIEIIMPLGILTGVADRLAAP